MRKSIKYSLLAVLAVIGLASCSNDYEYSGAEAMKNAQVFFADKTLAITSYDLDMDANSFDVEIQRVKTDGELTVALENHQNPASTTQLNVPASVTFADGADKAIITIGYNPETIKFDDLNRDTLIIANAEYTTPYGGTEYRFAVGIPAPWTEWAATAAAFKAAGGTGEWPLGDEGTGSYTHVIMGSFVAEELPVTMRQSKLDPNQVQFKVENWGAEWFTDEGVELIMNGVWDAENEIYRIDVPFTFTGYVHSSYGNVYTADVVTYGAWRTANGASGWDVTWEQAPSYYTPSTGLFTLHMVDFVSAGSFGNDYEYLQMDGFYIPDYSAEAVYAGLLKTPAETYQGVVDFTLGPDIATAKYAMTSADVSEEAAAAAIVSGELEGEEITESGRVYLPLEEEGKYRVTIVTFNEEGEAMESASCVFEFEKGGSSWESLGECLYTDDFMTMGGYDKETGEWSPVYNGLEPETYAVELFASTKTPGLYRLKNAYGEVYRWNEEGDWDDSMDYFLEIDATDPENVFINKQELGLDWGKGMISVENDGAYYMNKWGATPAQVVAVFAENGLDSPFGTLANGAITFPEDVFTVSFGDYEFYGNHNGAFKVVLPEAASQSAIKAAKFARRLRAGKARFNAGKKVSNKQMSVMKPVKANKSFKPVVLK